MVKSGLAKIAKCLLCTATFLIFVGGLAVLSVGIWAALQKVQAVEELLGTEVYTYAAFGLIAAGTAITVISFLGCCGAYKEDKVKLALYFLVLFIIFVVLLAGGILGFIFKDKVEKNLQYRMQTTVKSYGVETFVTNSWNVIQTYFECCGLSKDGKESYRVWEENQHLKNDSLTVPITCCKDLENPEPCQKDPKTHAHPEDCYEVVKKYIMLNSVIVGGIGIGIAVALLIGMFLTCCLYQNIQKTPNFNARKI